MCRASPAAVHERGRARLRVHERDDDLGLRDVRSVSRAVGRGEGLHKITGGRGLVSKEQLSELRTLSAL